MDLIGLLFLATLIYGAVAILAVLGLAGWSAWCWIDNDWHTIALETRDEARLRQSG